MVGATLGLLSFLGWGDPAPGLTRSRTRSRTLECERVSAEVASRVYPGEVSAPGPRGDFVDRTALVCRERLMRAGLRAPRDEAVLAALDTVTNDLVLATEALPPEVRSSTWLVETYFPNAQVAAKIGFATKNALMAQGLKVSDRTPVLAAGDVEVITRMEPEEAYPSACERYHQTGSLGEGDVLLAVLVRDLRETVLHGGLCIDGAWTWLR